MVVDTTQLTNLNEYEICGQLEYLIGELAYENERMLPRWAFTDNEWHNNMIKLTRMRQERNRLQKELSKWSL